MAVFGKRHLLLALLAVWAPVRRGYEVYEDEYKNTQLPGHQDDPRGLPNLPFTVDGNRQSDGVSSVSPLTMTSPSTPYYREDEVEINDPLREHARRKRMSEAEQGVGQRMAGAANREEALIGLFKPDMEIYQWSDFDRTAASLHYYPNKTFPVNASVLWNPSAFAIQTNEEYRVEVKHGQQWTDGQILTDADGYKAHYDAVSKCYVAGGRCRSYLRESRRLPLANWFELVCGVGNYVWKLQEAANGTDRFMPLREDEFTDTIFAVGSDFTFNATDTGELVCFANDNYGQYWNNRGVLHVTVTRTSWPPKLPKNDSTPFRYFDVELTNEERGYR